MLMLFTTAAVPEMTVNAGNSYAASGSAAATADERKNETSLTNELYARAAVLMDAENGRILFSKNGDEVLPMASTTKIMTCVLALETGNPEDVLPVSSYAARQPKVHMGVQKGEYYRMEDLLYGLMLRSGNDAAVALAIATAGSMEAFVGRMNEKAQALGLTNTHFENPNGLDGEVHYSTARDLAKLSVCAMQNETFRAVVSSKSFTENGRSFTNHNKLLWRVDGADGIKTGYTKRAGRILAGSAVRDGRRLVCVTICDPDDWRDQQALFDYGFSAFSLQTLVREGDTVGSVPVVGGRLERVSLTAAEEISYPLAESERTELVLHAPQLAFAPVLAGQAGWLELRVDGVCVREVPVYYAQAVEETRPARSFWKRMFGG